MTKLTQTFVDTDNTVTATSVYVQDTDVTYSVVNILTLHILL